MKKLTKKQQIILKKIINWSGLFFFGLAVFMIYHQLSKYSMDEIKDSIVNVPFSNIFCACVASMLGYLALSSYDYLALKYVGKKLSTWKWMVAGFIGFSVSNNAGHAVVSGGAVRYRLYSRWNVSGTDIIKMVTFSGFTYLIACFFLVIIGFVCSPYHLDFALGKQAVYNWLIMILAFVGLVVYVWGSTYYKKPLIIKEIEFYPPGLKMSLAQIFIGSADILMASTVLYMILKYYVDVSFFNFIGMFIIAQLLGIYSQVPGGLGVFEVVFAKLLPDDQNQAVLFASLILYRLIYYLLPLLISTIIICVYEVKAFTRKKILFKKKKNIDN